MSLIVSCPTCDAQVTWAPESAFRPFCSKRCQLIDLGEWAEEKKSISQPIPGATPLNEEMLDALEEQFIQHNKFFVEPE